MKLNEAVARRTKECCEENLMSLNSLSKMSGVPKTTLRDILSCKIKSPNLESVLKIAHGLEMTLRDFFDEDIFDDVDRE